MLPVLSPQLLARLPVAAQDEYLELFAEQRKHFARTRLIDFATYVWPRYVADPFHVALADALEAVMRGEIKRLMLVAPPQHGKTSLTSSILPAFWLANRPDDRVMITSYEAGLATASSYNARELIKADEFRALFPNITTRRDSEAKDEWRIAGHLGGVLAAGVGGGISGRPAELAIIDDPVRNYRDAASHAYQEMTWQWYQTSLYPRLQEDAPIVMILTRWHERDLAGQLLTSKEAQDWTVLRFPALAETQADRDDGNSRLGLPVGLPDPIGRKPDVALAPHRFSARYLRRLRDSGTIGRWYSLYQGVPRPPEGNIIKREWLKIADSVPVVAERIRYWDKAGTADAGARSAGVLIAKVGHSYYVEDVVFGQWEAGDREAVIRQTAELDAQRGVQPDPQNPDLPLSAQVGYNSTKTYVEQEPGSGGKESAQATVFNLAGFPVYADPVSGQGSKEIRINPFAAQAQAGNVFVRAASWTADYIDEITSFPNGMFRDMGDATSGAFNKHFSGGFGLAILGDDEEEDEWAG